MSYLKQSHVRIDTPMAPPAWALMEWELIRTQERACGEFFERYFDERGYLECIPRWGGNDGPDDAIENLVNWPVLYVLGGGDPLRAMCELGWEGHLKQYTEAKTTEVPFARDGMYYREFPVMFDWVHNGEGLTTFNLHGLMDPTARNFDRRVRRFAGFYMGDDPQAPNYDKEHKIIRSLLNGSRGPMLRKATALDWAGDPMEEVEGRFNALHGERNFAEMLAHFEDYTDVAGDHPSNMVATTLGLNAFALTGEDSFRDWVLEYTEAWRQRTIENDGIIPTNIGLDGTIGGECDGKWYGGCYGWAFTVTVPQTGGLSSRNTHYLGIAGFGNALLFSGDQRYVDVWRQMIDKINSHAKTIDGQQQYPHMFGDEGWYDYSPAPYSLGALDVYYWSMERDDLKRLNTDSGWIGFLEGNDGDYPVAALQRDFERVRGQMEKVHNDTTTPDTRLSDNPNPLNPATIGSLVELMLGGMAPRHGCPLHCRLRYFDPEQHRPGMPDGVGALVEKLEADSTTVTLVNTDQVSGRRVIVQGGAYAEHRFDSVSVNGEQIDVNGTSFAVELAPGAGATLKIGTQRYASQPSFAFPWDRTA
ncbi:MAG: hypothetical protein VX528_14135 [Candidatus Latescibacterota bacterium]|nr:hypothetical protein [Candidatus Latescibacterota bacterium]MEE3335469.1 hypothetical protein [Candidatus Latescibacterota bacterium]